MIFRKKDSVIFFTKIRFFLAFLFLILLSTGIFMLLIYEVAQAEKDALLISVMSNQEGFIHRSTFLASSYAQSNDPRERKSLRDKVHETLTMILVFANGSPDGNITKAQVPAILNREVYHLYRGSPSKLNDEVVDYIASVKKFMLGSPIHVSSDYPHLKALNAQTIRLLSVLRAGVKKHQQETRRQILFLKNLGIALFVLMLVSLGIVGLFVFMPVIRKVESYLHQLRNVNDALEEKVRDRTAELEQKATELALSNQRLQDQIKERLKAEDDLRDANAFLDSVIENIPDMIFIKDAKELRFVRFNRAGEELLGRPREDFIGKNDYAFFPKEQADFFVQKDRETLRNKVLLEIADEPIDSAQKGRRILHTKKIPILDGSENPMYLLGISEDITERIHSEKRLRELSMAMENALDGIAKLDANMKFMEVNKAVAATLGYTPEEMVGLNRLVTICPEDHDKVRAAFKVMQEHGKADLEIKAIRKDGNIIHQYVVISRVLNDKGEFDSFYCFSKDVTEKKYHEAINIKSELIQMVSHELRTPIHSVKEGLSIVLEGLTGQLAPEQREVLEIAKRCADRLARLVNDVLAFHKLEAGVIDFRMKPADLNAVVADVAKAMGPLVREKGLSFSTELQRGLPAIEMDQDKVTQVITNFLQNAIKFTVKGGITIKTSLANDFVTVAIRDTGIGIQQKDIPKIFRKFGQLEAAKSIAPGGTGLGLAISKKIVEQHHGTVSLESEFRRGSVFSFSLPLSQPVNFHTAPV